jgi:hypothetical protein
MMRGFQIPLSALFSLSISRRMELAFLVKHHHGIDALFSSRARAYGREADRYIWLDMDDVSSAANPTTNETPWRLEE